MNASSKAKQKYNAKTYDRIQLMIPKGEKERLQEIAKASGLSLNAFVCEAIKNEVIRREQNNRAKCAVKKGL